MPGVLLRYQEVKGHGCHGFSGMHCAHVISSHQKAPYVARELTRPTLQPPTPGPSAQPAQHHRYQHHSDTSTSKAAKHPPNVLSDNNDGWWA